MVNVFIIDDHPAIIEGVAFLFSAPEDRVRLVGSSITMTDALKGLTSLNVQVILLDLFIGRDSPESNLRILRAVFPDIPVVIYSAEDSTWWKKTMFGLGVNAFLNKCTNNETIITTILQVSKGTILLPPEVKGLLAPDSSRKTNVFSWEELELGKGLAFGMTLKELSEKFHKSDSSIEKTIRSLRIKTQAHSNPELIRILFQRKLIPLSN
jgi:two-component system response regulator EvgA